jgi:ABC-type lipoprotein export system ATPase subunit/YHS domain-containing protein
MAVRRHSGTDIICGMALDGITDPSVVTYGGERYAFCGDGCAERFRKSPKRFLGTPLVKLQDVKKVYRAGSTETHALRGVDLHIWEGDFVAIIGASGSGKSTVLSMIGLLDLPTSGRVFLRGKNASLLSEDERAQMRSSTFGFIFQQYHMIPWLTAYENVTLPVTFADKPVDANFLHQRFRSLGLEQRMHHRPSELSGGEQQRTALIRALVNDPRILLGDEPTGNLDSETGGKILDLLMRLNAQEKKTLIIVTHDAGIAEKADQIITVKDGVIVRDHHVHKQLYTT